MLGGLICFSASFPVATARQTVECVAWLNWYVARSVVWTAAHTLRCPENASRNCEFWDEIEKLIWWTWATFSRLNSLESGACGSNYFEQ